MTDWTLVQLSKSIEARDAAENETKEASEARDAALEAKAKLLKVNKDSKEIIKKSKPESEVAAAKLLNDTQNAEKGKKK